MSNDGAQLVLITGSKLHILLFLVVRLNAEITCIARDAKRRQEYGTSHVYLKIIALQRRLDARPSTVLEGMQKRRK